MDEDVFIPQIKITSIQLRESDDEKRLEQK